MKENIPIKVGEIRKALKHNENLAVNPSSREISGKEGYGTKEHQWRSHDSLLEGSIMLGIDRSFGKTFRVVLPEKYVSLTEESTFRSYIEKTLSERKARDLTGVEFGGPGSNLFKGFSEHFFRRTVGVCLEDIRSKKQKDEDTKNNHSVISGDVMDVLSNKTLDNVKQELATEKTDLIISRMRGPLIFIDKNLAILDRIIRNWYDMLNENGLMFIQFEHEPSSGTQKRWVKDHPNEDSELRVSVEKWTNTIKKRFPEIDIDIKTHSHQRVEGVMRFHKRPGSPEHLPPATQLFS